MLQGADDAEAAAERSDEVETVETKRIWGALSSDVMEPLDAPAAVASVLLRPSSIPVELMDQMHALIPVEVLPKEGDTPGSLAARLSENQYLHPKYVLKNGNGSGKQTYVQLNSTQYAQPRRVRWGLPKEIQWPEGEDGVAYASLPCYQHSYSRSPLENTCEVVPGVVRQLTQFLWKTAKPFLAPNSTCAPPNYWEQCIYYTAFQGAMGRHRDNFKSQDLVSYYANKDPSVLTTAKYAQVPNSSVMIYTTGNAPMTLKLSYPASRQTAGYKEMYVEHPSLCVKLSHGTLFILAPTDDLFYCHEVSFDSATLAKSGHEGYRIALVMRWIRDDYFQMFHAKGPSTRCLLVTPSMAEAEDERVKRIRKRKNRNRF